MVNDGCCNDFSLNDQRLMLVNAALTMVNGSAAAPRYMADHFTEQGIANISDNRVILRGETGIPMCDGPMKLLVGG